jgi:carboxyl-terminal processing protease
MIKSEKLRIVLLILIAGFLGYYIGVSKISFAWNNFQPHIEVSSKEPPASLQAADASRIWDVLEKIEATYYDKEAINSEKVINGAIQGMLASLDDPYTVYLPPKENSDFKQGLAGKFEGIGAELSLKDNAVVVVAPIDGSPAKKAGIGAGDIIIKVNNESVSGKPLNEVVEKIRGPKGTEITLNILQKDAQEPKDVKLVRDEITVKSLTSWTKKVKEVEGVDTKAGNLGANAENKVIYIRLSQFGDSTNAEWMTLASTIDRQLTEDKSIKGIVFDLRNNPGGYLNDAVYIASEFVPTGTAVMQEDKNKKRTEFPVTGKGLLTDVPVVVLINKGSASASEIVSGALRDHNRAKLVGETSFGKGTIQQAEDLGGGAGLHVTIAKWLTPDGNWVGNGKDGQGLKPDVEVAVDKEDPSHDVQLEKAINELLQ